MCKLKLAESQKAEADKQWQQKLIDTTEDLKTVWEARIDQTRKFAAKVEADSERALAELREVHAGELDRRVAVFAEALAQRDTDIQRVDRRREEAEQYVIEAETQYQRRLAHVEKDLKTARETIRRERDLAVQAQADGERAVLRTIEGFWNAQVEDTSKSTYFNTAPNLSY